MELTPLLGCFMVRAEEMAFLVRMLAWRSATVWVDMGDIVYWGRRLDMTEEK